MQGEQKSLAPGQRAYRGRGAWRVRLGRQTRVDRRWGLQRLAVGAFEHCQAGLGTWGVAQQHKRVGQGAQRLGDLGEDHRGECQPFVGSACSWWGRHWELHRDLLDQEEEGRSPAVRSP